MTLANSMSGFPELLPAERSVETMVIDTARLVFELHGFSSVETRAVETVETLLRKGDIDKEVYGVHRLADGAASVGQDPASDLALRFDLTVPFARYVVANAGKLSFPFRRYQIQRVWRGERPQEGRYREFTQADIDVVGDGDLPFHYDVELPVVMSEVFTRLEAAGLPRIVVRVNNRKLAEGFYRGLGLEDPSAVLGIVDKLDKIGKDKVAHLLIERCGATEKQAKQCLKLAQITGSGEDVIKAVSDLGVSHEQLTTGLDELGEVLQGARDAGSPLVADLSIARGLDYYTGTVYESTMEGFAGLGSVCSGGRYDSLASDGKTTYPGVGISFGVSRALLPLFSYGYTATRSVPTCVLVALNTDDERSSANATAAALRSRGISTLVAPKAAKFGKQIKFADKRGIPFVWFSDGGAHQVKDIRTGEQVDADPATWEPPIADVVPRVVTPA